MVTVLKTILRVLATVTGYCWVQRARMKSLGQAVCTEVVGSPEWEYVCAKRESIRSTLKWLGVSTVSMADLELQLEHQTKSGLQLWEYNCSNNRVLDKRFQELESKLKALGAPDEVLPEGWSKEAYGEYRHESGGWVSLRFSRPMPDGVRVLSPEHWVGRAAREHKSVRIEAPTRDECMLLALNPPEGAQY